MPSTRRSSGSRSAADMRFGENGEMRWLEVAPPDRPPGWRSTRRWAASPAAAASGSRRPMCWPSTGASRDRRHRSRSGSDDHARRAVPVHDAARPRRATTSPSSRLRPPRSGAPMRGFIRPHVSTHRVAVQLVMTPPWDSSTQRSAVTPWGWLRPRCRARVPNRWPCAVPVPASRGEPAVTGEALVADHDHVGVRVAGACRMASVGGR